MATLLHKQRQHQLHDAMQTTSAPMTAAAASGSASVNTATTNAATDSDDSSHSNNCNNNQRRIEDSDDDDDDEVLSHAGEGNPAEPEKSRCSDNNFQLNIPSILMQPHQSLAQMDQKMLGESLQPVLDSLKALDAQALLNLERVENGARLRDGVNIRPIHGEVYPQYDSQNGGNMSCVRYIHITEVPDQYSIGIFVFPPFARIPLHDHPEMCVLSRVLYGDLQCLSLDLPTVEEQQDEAETRAYEQHASQQQQEQLHPQSSFMQHPYQAFQAARDHLFRNNNGGQHHPAAMYGIAATVPPGAKRAYKNPVKHLHAPDVGMLFPYKGNLHEFFAGPNGAAVLDILLPPYDVDHDRDCTFYDIREDPVAAGSAAGGEERTPCWIVPTKQPHDFHCLSGKYQKLGANVVHSQENENH